MPPAAARVMWRDTEDPHGIAHRYGFISTLLAAGVDAARIQVFHDPEVDAAYWVVTLDGGRAAVLTDDTEEHVGHLEGPWPFKAVFLGPDGVRTKICYSIDRLKVHVVTWCAEDAGPA
ncbi:hypothetical protein WKI68_07610 [Streptomyces sp. MS1.HAVA.3]|uniref:Uncharacterized protein n=1 Tax=Streptomyces caledonius TaxID=3134107 RepID=A0ABU8U2D3_9ACTN